MFGVEFMELVEELISVLNEMNCNCEKQSFNQKLQYS